MLQGLQKNGIFCLRNRHSYATPLLLLNRSNEMYWSMCRVRLPARSLSHPTSRRDSRILEIPLKYLKPWSSCSFILCLFFAHQRHLNRVVHSAQENRQSQKLFFRQFPLPIHIAILVPNRIGSVPITKQISRRFVEIAMEFWYIHGLGLDGRIWEIVSTSTEMQCIKKTFAELKVGIHYFGISGSRFSGNNC